jgi:hypothetical protein
MLCDYEKIVDSKNQRQVAFGKFKFLFSIIWRDRFLATYVFQKNRKTQIVKQVKKRK